MKHEVAKDRNKRRTTAYLGRIRRKKKKKPTNMAEQYMACSDGKAEINHREKRRR